MITITRTFGIDVGHRLLRHESKCRNVHGHRYTIEVEFILAMNEGLDAVGRIIDFGEVKQIVGKWLDDEWDHGFIAQEGDPIVDWLRANEMKHKVYPFAPTAENMVGCLARELPPLMPDRIIMTRVRLWETPNCAAEFVL